MFHKVTETWNPLGGRCPHECVYCFSMGEKGLVKKFDMKKYQGPIRLIEKEFKRKFKDGSFVFVQDMSDLFADAVPYNYICKVLNHIEDFPKTTFLLLTKNPRRYSEFYIPKNCICGATIESDYDYDDTLAPTIGLRYYHMMGLRHRKMISIEPIMDFYNVEDFIEMIAHIEPEFIYIGFDNYNNNLPEPSLNEVKLLIKALSKVTTVYTKTLRKAWNE